VANTSLIELAEPSFVSSNPDKMRSHRVSPTPPNYPESGQLLPAAPARRYNVSDDYWVETSPLQSAVIQYAADWQSLVEHASSPNVFYEPWFLKIVHEHLTEQAKVEVILVYHREKNPAEKPYLCAVFPLVFRPGKLLLTTSTIASLFEHSFGYLHTPHLREGYGMESVLALLKWLTEVHPEVSLLEFNRIPGEGHLAHIIQQLIHDYPITSFVVDTWNRAVLVPDVDSEEYLTSSTSNQQYRELKRKKRRLSETGLLEIRDLNASTSLSELTEAFLSLEQQGWKGEKQSAIAQNPAQKAFVEQMLAEALKRNQLQFFGYYLDNKPIAVKCNLLAGSGSFSWKIAYDESLQKFSPGVLLELENVHRFHEQTELDWMDSCAAPNHPMIDRLWKDRRNIKHLFLTTKHWQGHLHLGLLQFLRSAKRFWKRRESFEVTKHNF
jgi:hypothetical protein